MNLVSVKDISDRYQLSYQTVNYYTSIGLLAVKERKGNVRFYDECDTSERLAKILKLKNEGYPLRLITRRLNGAKIL